MHLDSVILIRRSNLQIILHEKYYITFRTGQSTQKVISERHHERYCIHTGVILRDHLLDTKVFERTFGNNLLQ